MNNGKHYKQCPYCEKSYVSTPAYSMHVRTHGQGYSILYLSYEMNIWLILD